VVVVVQVRVRRQTEGFEWKLSDQHALPQVDTYMFEDDVTRPEHALVIQGASLGGLVRWSDVCNLKNVCLLRAV